MLLAGTHKFGLAFLNLGHVGPRRTKLGELGVELLGVPSELFEITRSLKQRLPALGGEVFIRFAEVNSLFGESGARIRLLNLHLRFVALVTQTADDSPATNLLFELSRQSQKEECP